MNPDIYRFNVQIIADYPEKQRRKVQIPRKTARKNADSPDIYRFMDPDFPWLPLLCFPDILTQIIADFPDLTDLLATHIFAQITKHRIFTFGVYFSCVFIT